MGRARVRGFVPRARAGHPAGARHLWRARRGQRLAIARRADRPVDRPRRRRDHRLRDEVHGGPLPHRQALRHRAPREAGGLPRPHQDQEGAAAGIRDLVRARAEPVFRRAGGPGITIQFVIIIT